MQPMSSNRISIGSFQSSLTSSQPSMMWSQEKSRMSSAGASGPGNPSGHVVVARNPG